MGRWSDTEYKLLEGERDRWRDDARRVRRTLDTQQAELVTLRGRVSSQEQRIETLSRLTQEAQTQEAGAKADAVRARDEVERLIRSTKTARAHLGNGGVAIGDRVKKAREVLSDATGDRVPTYIEDDPQSQLLGDYATYSNPEHIIFDGRVCVTDRGRRPVVIARYEAGREVRSVAVRVDRSDLMCDSCCDCMTISGALLDRIRRAHHDFYSKDS